jgi:hypothetical protein
MKSDVLTDVQPKTDEEYKREADRLLREVQAMLDEIRSSRERGRRNVAKTQMIREDLRKRLSCGND